MAPRAVTTAQWTDDYLVQINIGRLLTAKAMARAIASGEIANLSLEAASSVLTSGFVTDSNELRPDEARRNDCHAQLIP